MLTIYIDFSIHNNAELLEQAITSAYARLGHYNFTIEPQGISWGIGDTNLAHFVAIEREELNVRSLVYENNG